MKILSKKQLEHMKKLAKLHKGTPKSKTHRINQSNALKGRFTGENNFNYKHGECKKEHYCPFCGKTLSSYQAKMCVSCARKKQIRTHNGRNFPNCFDCGKKLSHYKSKRCHSCEGKKRWANKEYKEKTLKAMFCGYNLTANKPEKELQKLLNNLFVKEYKFVGNGKIFIGGFVPDFVNINGQKKIIELYGDYWHNIKGAKARDINRIISYRKYGYKTLIVWERELKNKVELIQRLKDFNKC